MKLTAITAGAPCEARAREARGMTGFHLCGSVDPPKECQRTDGTDGRPYFASHLNSNRDNPSLGCENPRRTVPSTTFTESGRPSIFKRPAISSLLYCSEVGCRGRPSCFHSVYALPSVASKRYCSTSARSNPAGSPFTTNSTAVESDGTSSS